VCEHDGSPVPASPRQVLIAQYERAHELGYTPMFASELEFYLYKESYAEAHGRDYRGLTPTIPYILDYHVLATTMDEPYLGPIRRGMQAAGIPVEFSKGEAWYGQHEVNVRYADAITSADRHTIYKNGVKEIAFLEGISASSARARARACSSTAARRPTRSATTWAACARGSGSWRCSWRRR
jgi:glutamine synthetase